MTSALNTPENLIHTDSLQLLERLKGFYHNLKQAELDALEAIYEKDVVFKDPVHEIRGSDKLHTYMSGLYQGLYSGRFEYLDELLGCDSAYIKWHMYFRHKKLGDREICVRGISHLQFHHKIYYHEDIYDLGEMLYEHLPLLGPSTRWLKKRLGAGH